MASGTSQGTKVDTVALTSQTLPWKTTSKALGETPGASEVTKAHFKRGLDWEISLFSWLDRYNLLLKVPSKPLDPATLLENILADQRSHFFIAGLAFLPPQHDLNERFAKEKREPLVFGLAKPDLLEITKVGKRVLWRVIDAKATKHVTTSHYIQIYFYTLCLNILFSSPPYESTDTAGVWLHTGETFNSAPPSANDIKPFSIALLAPSLDALLFRELPKVIGLPYNEVKWHYNPLCHGCRYEPECRRRASDEGQLGAMPNISIDDANDLRQLLRISRVTDRVQSERPLPDIEELDRILKDHTKLDLLAKSSTLMKKAKQILGIPKKTSSVQHAAHSPVVEACRSRNIQVIPRRNSTCPKTENIAVVISVITDPSSPSSGGDYFNATVHSETAITPPAFVCPSSEFVPTFANLIRSLDTLYSICSANTCQFYVWSTTEHAALQNTVIQAALISTASREDVQLCIGALLQGASLLRTTFQPLLLSGALLSFLANSRRSRAEYQVCLERMGLPIEGTVEVLRQRVENEIRKLKEATGALGHERDRKEIAQLPRVVILKKEIERQLALPIPGYWDLPDCAHLFSPSAPPCPSNEQIFVAYKNLAKDGALQELLFRRNRMIYQVLKGFRARATTPDGVSYLLNEAKTLSTQFMDICKEEHIRKLFFMQQFEVLAKLTELWQSRMDGCPDAPVLQYCDVTQGPHGIEYVFRIISGSVDDPAPDREYSFFNKLLVQDFPSSIREDDNIPAEALFDDLEVSGLVFPLNRYTHVNWTKQDDRVQKELSVADVRKVYSSSDKRHTMVSLRIWGTGPLIFRQGETYRLSPRLIDFNTVKVLSALLEIDLRWDSGDPASQCNNMHRGVPFLRLITDPDSLGMLPMAKQYLKTEKEIQMLFRDLAGLGNMSAKSLVLKASQHKAAQRILSQRLSIVWGPPGTGKTHTISLSLLRVIEVERRNHGPQPKIFFITAITNAAIRACYGKVLHLIEAYRATTTLSMAWLADIQIEIVTKGSDHLPPPRTSSDVLIYAGTVYQLYVFAKKNSILVDCVIVDEAGQMSLGPLSLVVRSLRPQGRIIITGDSQQLAPILNAKYPSLQSRPLFGSILDCLMFTRPLHGESALLTPSIPDDGEPSQSQGSAIQLIENFRLNSDLGEFISTIYARQFRPQKVQARQLPKALALANEKQKGLTLLPEELTLRIRTFLVALSNVMLNKEVVDELIPPAIKSTSSAAAGASPSTLPYHPTSLSLIRLRSWSKRPLNISYEMHIHAEAAVAAALVHFLQACCPSDDIFVATPYRIQREAVKQALARVTADDSLQEAFGRLNIDGNRSKQRVTVDTIERLQGSEASFVICLFSVPKSFPADQLDFLLDRRRLNVAFSRAKALCILISSDEILCPPVKVLAKEATAKGYAFLKAYQQRAWSYHLPVQVEKVM